MIHTLSTVWPGDSGYPGNHTSFVVYFLLGTLIFLLGRHCGRCERENEKKDGKGKE